MRSRPAGAVALAALLLAVAGPVWGDEVPPAAAAAEPPAGREIAASPAPLPTAAAAAAPASQPLLVPLVKGKTLQPGEPGYKSPAVAAAWSFGTTLLPVIVGGFMVRAQSQAVMWVGFTLIVGGQSLGPAAGYWYAGEKARFTWHRLALTVGAFGAAIYPLYAYTGRFDSYNTGGAAALMTIAIIAEGAALSLAAWDLSLLGDAIERHNYRPAPTQGRPKPVRAGLPVVAPLALPGGGGVGIAGRF
jgi:uncharacterized membrane protein YidH (DUF202 family)